MLCVLIILWPLWRGFVLYDVGWYGSDDVDIRSVGEG